MEKLISDLKDYISVTQKLIDQGEKTGSFRDDSTDYVEGYKDIFETFKSIVGGYAGEVLEPDINKRQDFLRRYINFYKLRYDHWNHIIITTRNELQLYKQLDRLRGKREACRDIYNELLKMFNKLPEVDNEDSD